MAKPGYKECPYCAEEIRESAIKCRYCQTMLIQQDEFQPVAISAPNIPQREQSEIQRLSQFIPAQVLQGIITGSEMMEEGERRNISILFADIAGFTPLSETLDPEELKDLIDHYLGAMTEVIAKYHGTIDKFIGDEVMALFGAPVTHENDPELAIRAALEIQEVVAKLGIEFQRDLKVRIGVSCGDVIVGGLGGKSRLDYTAIGDVVNLSKRLETMAEPGQIVVSRRIYERTQTAFEFQSLGQVHLKGKSEPVLAYLPVKSIREYDRLPFRSISSTELIGRETELQLLFQVVGDCKKGQGVVVHLKGESGVGKSRLIYELRKKSAELGVQFYYGRSLSYGKNSPYLPFIDLLIRGICRIPDTTPKQDAAKQVGTVLLKLSRNLKQDIPYIQYFVSPEMVDVDIAKEDPKVRMQKIFMAVQRVIEESARQKPLILEFEDLQWADHLTLTLLNHLIPAIANIPVVFLFVYRPYFVTAWQTGTKQIELELKELSVVDSEKLVRQLLGYSQLSDELIEKIIQKTEGNPFYTEEVVLYLEQTNVLLKTDQGWELTKSIRDIIVPDTVQGVVLSRLDRLETKAKRILQCASVIGHAFRYRLLDYILKVERDLEQDIAKLVGMGLILEQTVIPELVYLFRHIITQEVTYNTLLIRRRKLFHEKIAQCLESIYTDRIEEHFELIAHHYSNCDNHVKALEYLVKAGDKCRKLFANEAALDFYTQALERTKHYPGTLAEITELESRLRINRGRVSELVGDMIFALSDNIRASEIAAENRHFALLISARQNIGELYRQQGKYKQAIEFTEQALALAKKQKSINEEFYSINRLAVIYRDLGENKKALEYFEKVLKIGEKRKDLMLQAHAYNNLGLTYMSMGKFAEALRHIQLSLELRVEIGDKKGQVQGFNNLGILNERLGNYEEALNAYGECVRRAREIGFKKGEISVKINMGWIYWIQGKEKEALLAYQQVYAESSAMADIQSQSLALCNMGYIYMFEDNYEKALESFQQGLELAKSAQDYYSQVSNLNGLLELCIRNKKYKQAEQTGKKAIALIGTNLENENAAITYRLLADLALANKDLDSAEKYIKKSNTLSSQANNLREMAWCALTSARIEKAKKNPKLAQKWQENSRDIANQLKDVHCLKELQEMS